MVSFGETYFKELEKNEYLMELYDAILYNYALKVFGLPENKFPPRAFEIMDALRFADLLSKSTAPDHSVKHKMWAQEIAALLYGLYPRNEDVLFFAGAILHSVGNYQGQQLLGSTYSGVDAYDRIYSAYCRKQLAIPADKQKTFFPFQKAVYNHLNDDCFSYSGPTSMGKSFIMRMFLKEDITMKDAQKNYALIVPTKALINEVRRSIITDLGESLEKCNYRVVTAASDIALEEQHNFILVLTPERLLYLLISYPDLQIDYLFIDEAHKLSGKNSRGPFYYKVVDMLLRREHRPRFIFAAPNIPNPQVYLRLMNDVIETGDDKKLATTYSPVMQIKFLMNLRGKEIAVYNEHSGQTIKVANIKAGDVNLNTMLLTLEFKNRVLSPEERLQTIVYYNGRNKAIKAAQIYANCPEIQEKHDVELDNLSKDIAQEVHGDYFLSGMIKKGVAYHVGYLPASIRTRIENLFRCGKITTMFCTSTLLEGVNLPADNLFITDNKIFRSEMNPVDFRNLIGRVGRISFNLYGNVFFVSDDKSVTPEKYIEMLQTPVPSQELSVTTDPKVLKKVEKKYVVDILKQGDALIPQRTNDNGKELQSEEEYIMMRKFGLVLLRDIMENRDSFVRKSFADILSPADEAIIREKFSTSPTLPDDDINTSVDQTKRLILAIRRGLQYPQIDSGIFHYEDIIKFLATLSDVFEWDIYEKNTLGKESLRRWYAVILCQWMEGYGLSYIMRSAIDYKRKHPENFRVSAYEPPTIYDDCSKEHRNVVFAEVLETIENVILFSISNYFLRFSNEYKKVHGVTEFDNNWYEYVEFGTTNPITILLQRNGFSREAATYIRSHQAEYVTTKDTGILCLRKELLSCGNTSIEMEAADIILNAPGLFV